MGFDIYGMNPVTDTKKPVPQDFTKKKVDEDNYFTEMSKSERQKYFDAKWEWEGRNPGTYFRNNVWWWRPLWDFTCYYVGCLTDTDHEQGHFNSGHEISKNKAEQIALTLKELLEDGEVDLYKAWYENETKDDEYEYPFHVENVKAFADFCKDSGGFSIQ